MSHYEEQLARDLESLGQRIAAVAERVLVAQRDAVRCLLNGDRALAAQVILGDLPINRAIRAIDHQCHVFVARHLPSAGHLRYVSSVLRLDIELERIGDYAATIAREALQLTEPPPALVARGIELMAEQSHAVLAQAIRAWNEGNSELARGTRTMAAQASAAFDKAFKDLLREGEEGKRPLADVMSLLAVLTRLGRVADQAKNLCEETLFAVAGETKEPKTYRVLFVDGGDDAYTQLALAYARKAFGEGCEYDSAGWTPAKQIEPRCRLFLERRGFDGEDLAPSRLEDLHETLARYHVVVSLGGDLRPHVTEIPFHTVVLEWDPGPALAGFDQERALALLDESLEGLASKIRDLYETLRGLGDD